MEYDTNQFLILERSFSSGYLDGGMNIKIYDVDANMATDISGITSLINAEYQTVKKTLLLDLESIRSKLTNGIVDNIEGMTFGPNLSNGNQSLVLVADNNFSAVLPQMNQFLLFELKN